MLRSLQNVAHTLKCCKCAVLHGVAGVAESFKALRLGQGPLKILQRFHVSHAELEGNPEVDGPIVLDRD